MTEILNQDNILTNLPVEPYKEVIVRCGEMLLDSGYVKEPYIKGMLERDASFSTAIGNLIAIPHGTKEYQQYINNTGLVVLTYPEGIPWGDETVKLVIGIAANGDEHLSILERIVTHLEDESAVNALVDKGDKQAIYMLLTP